MQTPSERYLGSSLESFRPGRLDEAVCEFQQVIRLYPGSSRGHLGLAILLRKRGELDDAVFDAELSVGAHPGDAESRYTLGRLFLQRHRAHGLSTDLDSAAQAVKEALPVDPHHSQANQLYQEIQTYRVFHGNEPAGRDL